MLIEITWEMGPERSAVSGLLVGLAAWPCFLKKHIFTMLDRIYLDSKLTP